MAATKALVVYYSRTGTTKQVAEAIADALQCDVEELIDAKNRKGAIGWLGAAKDARAKKLTAIKEVKNDPSSYDLVILGTPVWAWNMTPAIRAYITQQKDRLPQVAFFLTTGSTGIEGTFDHMEQLSGKRPLARLGLKTGEVRKGDYQDKVRAFVEELEASKE